jgi:hypothetical protein
LLGEDVRIDHSGHGFCSVENELREHIVNGID